MANWISQFRVYLVDCDSCNQIVLIIAVGLLFIQIPWFRVYLVDWDICNWIVLIIAIGLLFIQIPWSTKIVTWFFVLRILFCWLIDSSLEVTVLGSLCDRIVWFLIAILTFFYFTSKFEDMEDSTSSTSFPTVQPWESSSSPYYLSSSDNPTVSLVIQHLTEENYSTWRDRKSVV